MSACSEIYDGHMKSAMLAAPRGACTARVGRADGPMLLQRRDGSRV